MNEKKAYHSEGEREREREREISHACVVCQMRVLPTPVDFTREFPTLIFFQRNC
jgi:hypothetical protein